MNLLVLIQAKKWFSWVKLRVTNSLQLILNVYWMIYLCNYTEKLIRISIRRISFWNFLFKKFVTGETSLKKILISRWKKLIYRATVQCWLLFSVVVILASFYDQVLFWSTELFKFGVYRHSARVPNLHTTICVRITTPEKIKIIPFNVSFMKTMKYYSVFTRGPLLMDLSPSLFRCSFGMLFYVCHCCVLSRTGETCRTQICNFGKNRFKVGLQCLCWFSGKKKNVGLVVFHKRN